MGFPGSVLLSGADVLKTTTVKIHPLGTRGYTRDGRSFRYSRNGAAVLKPGVPIQSSVPSALEVLCVTGTTALRANTSRVKIVSGATPLLTTANSYADGFLYLRTSSTLKGYAQYAQIKSHTTASITGTAVSVIDFYSGDVLYSPTTNAGTTNCAVAVIRNPYDKLVVKPSGIVTAAVMGVAVRPIAVNAYFWIQTWGPCPVRADTVATKIGRAVGPSTGTSARMSGVNSTINTSAATALYTWTFLSNVMTGLGVQMVVAVSGEYRMVFLKMAP